MTPPEILTAEAGDGTGPTADPARRRLVDALVGPPVVGLALVVVVLAGAGAYRATRDGVAALRNPATTASARQTLTAIDAVRAEFAAQVSAGSRVYIDPTLADPVWRLYLLEFAAMTGVLAVPEVGQADHIVSVVRAPRGADLRLTVTRVR